MADKRTYSLDIQPTLDLDQSLLVDDLAFGEAKQITGQTLLRTRATLVLDRSGFSTAALSYTAYTNCNLTINQDCNVTFTAKRNETLYLSVTKGVDDVVTFSGAGGTVDAMQIGLTSLKFKIDSLNGATIVSQINNQFGDSLIIGNLTPVFGTITTFNYFNSVTNDNVCNFEAAFTYTPGATVSGVSINIANWDVEKYNTGYTACASMCLEGATVISTNAYIKEDNLSIDFTPSISIATGIFINGSFRIK